MKYMICHKILESIFMGFSSYKFHLKQFLKKLQFSHDLSGGFFLSWELIKSLEEIKDMKTIIVKFVSVLVIKRCNNIVL